MNRALAVPAQPFNAADLATATKVFAFASMCIGMFIALLDIQIVSASLRDIGGGLSAGTDETAWVQTSYLIAEIIVIPLSGWLSRVFSTRWLFCASAVGFTLASLLCGAAWNIQSMIAFRALQGFLGGSMIPLVFTTAFFFFTGKQRVIAAATIGAVASLAPTLGPVIGGWITDVSSWHWLFYINLVPGIFVAVAVPLLVKIDQPELSLLKGADYLSMLFMALFLGCLEYTLEEGPRSHDSDHGMDQRPRRSGLHRPNPARGQSGGRFARLERSQFRPRLLLFICHRDRPVRHDLPDAAVSRSGAWLWRAGHWSGGFFHRGVPDHGHSAVRLSGQPRRPALDHDDRPGAVRLIDVGFQPDHP
jgi:hypothetical protein